MASLDMSTTEYPETWKAADREKYKPKYRAFKSQKKIPGKTSIL